MARARRPRDVMARVSCVPIALAAALVFGEAAHAADVADVAALDVDAALARSQAALGGSLRDHELRDIEDRPVRLATLRGKPLVMSFVYTGCFQVCPTTTRSLKRAVESSLATFGTDAFNVVTVGFNQPFDSPVAMRAYATAQGVHLPNWRFLSPDARTLAALTEDVGFSFVARSGGFDHLTQVSVIDAQGRLYRQIYGEGFAPPQLIEPLKELLTGQPSMQAGSTLRALVDRVRLLCTYYDPATGRYRYNYTIFVELAGGVTGVLALALFVWRQRRAM